jgi:ABC-type Zn uptake system ZnuABC Zn-binding protein ZnuA
MLPYFGSKIIDDHNMWPYFARRFVVDGHIEPKPGVPPTTSHLADLVARMRADGVQVIVSAPYYDPRHARFLADITGARIAPLAHITGSRPGADTYIAMLDYNVTQLVRALAPRGTSGP